MLKFLPTMERYLGDRFPSVQEECDMDIYEDDIGYTTCTRYTIFSINLSLHTFSQFLRHILHEQYKPSWSHSDDLIYYICLLVWNNANDRDKQKFATIKAEPVDYESDERLYFIVDFSEIYNYIVEKSLVICHGFANANFPNDLRWSDKENYSFKHFDGDDASYHDNCNAVVLSIRNAEWYDKVDDYENAKTALFSQIGECQLFTIRDLTDIISSYYFEGMQLMVPP